MNTTTLPKLTDYVSASEVMPTRVGPYECQVTGVHRRENAATHFRWWNGQKWSFPLDYDRAFDTKIVEPGPSHYAARSHAQQVADQYGVNFEWRGYSEDPDPL